MKSTPCRAFAAALVIAVNAFAQAPDTGAPAPSAQPPPSGGAKGKYQNFDVAIYIPVTIVQALADPKRLEDEWGKISSQLKVDKVYIEGERDRVMADDQTLEAVKAFFVDHGVKVAGGITFSDSGGGGQFRSFCYTDPADREFVKRATQLVARHFDEMILDDFFFVTTKYPSDIDAKGKRSWTDFRLQLMDDAARELVVGAAKAINPKIKVVIKYPNWYEHFAGSGFDLAEEPKIFDGIYTGTETRDPNSTDQFLQQYESYAIIRYFDHVAPGRNGGGWVDTFSIEYLDRYPEQLWDTMLAKAPEMTLFQWSGLLQPAQQGDRSAWDKLDTSFDYQKMLAYRPAGAPADVPTGMRPTMARVAGYSLEQIDAVVGKLGHPIGIKSYRPPHATGDDYLHNYLGMVGIPIELYPEFPHDAPVVLLTESARGDPEIVSKIKEQLLTGKSVVVTAALYRALMGHGIEDIVELEPTEKHILADGYSVGYGPGSRAMLTNTATGAPPILFPQIRFLTNDAWALVSAMSDGLGFPLLLMDRYGKEGKFYVWNVPENFHQLYRLPPAVIGAVKDVVMRDFPVRLDGPSQVALFAYDNHTLVAESFLPTETDVQVSVLGQARKLRDLTTNEAVIGHHMIETLRDRRRNQPPDAGGRVTFSVHLMPHSYRAFAIEE